jgi:hypothetical protein
MGKRRESGSFTTASQRVRWRVGEGDVMGLWRMLLRDKKLRRERSLQGVVVQRRSMLP